MEVSTPSAAIPRSNHSPLTPVPVPTSTTARAPIVAARKHSAAPPAGATGLVPSVRARSRAAIRTSSSAR
jgi:hypothetical protein